MASSDVVVSWKNVRLTRGDVALFHEGHWLNDECITFFFEHLASKHRANIEGRVALIGAETVFWLANEDDMEELVDAAEALGLGSAELVLCPVNDHTNVASAGGSHWSLLVGRATPGPGTTSSPLVFEHYDSMSPTANGAAARRLAERLAALRAACGAAAAGGGAAAAAAGRAVPVAEVPAARQDNSCDCGVFVLLFAEAQLAGFLGSGGGAAAERLSPAGAAALRGELLQLVAEAAKPEA